MKLLPDAPKLKEFFNWLAAPAERSYTLGEAFQHYVQHKHYAEIRSNGLGYTNAGRLTERAHVAAGVVSAGLVLAFAPVSLPTLGIAAAFVGLYKVMGMAGGKLADGVVAGHFYNPTPKP